MEIAKNYVKDRINTCIEKEEASQILKIFIWYLEGKFPGVAASADVIANEATQSRFITRVEIAASV